MEEQLNEKQKLESGDLWLTKTAGSSRYRSVEGMVNSVMNVLLRRRVNKASSTVLVL